MYVFMVLSFAGFLCCWCIREPSISCSCSQCKDNTPVYLRHVWNKVQLVHGKSALLLTKHHFCLAQVTNDNTSHIYFFKKTEMVLFTCNLYSNKCLCRLSPPSLSNITVLPSSMTRLGYTYRSVLNRCDVVPSSFLPLFLSSCA